MNAQEKVDEAKEKQKEKKRRRRRKEEEEKEQRRGGRKKKNEEEEEETQQPHSDSGRSRAARFSCPSIVCNSSSRCLWH